MANAKWNFLGGVVVGAALGVVTGLLAAPSSGKQTRNKLKRKSKKYSKDAIRAVRQYLEGQNGNGSQRQLQHKASH